MNNAKSSTRPGAVTASFPLPADAVSATLWDALTSDVEAEVMVVTAEGVITAANAEAATFHGVSIGAMPGRTLSDILPENVAAERLAHVAEASRTGTGVVLEGFLRGAWRQTAIRPLNGTPTMILLVSGPVIGRESGLPRVRARSDELGLLEMLTTREREILALIGRGMSTVEIAEHLGRSVKTVEWHRVSLGSKFGISNRVELAHIALRAGLAQIEIGDQHESRKSPSRRRRSNARAVSPESL